MRYLRSSTIPAMISLAILLLEMSVIISARGISITDIGRIWNELICQGKSSKIKCENSSHAMVVYSAKYGRESAGRVLCPFNKNVQGSVILANETDDNSSDRALKCGYSNVTVPVMRLCDKKKECVVTANETYLGNPCKGVYKYLKVFYACVDLHKIQTVTYPLYTNPTIYTVTPKATQRPTFITVLSSTRRKAKATPTRKRVTTLTKRKKKISNNNTARKKPRSTRAPKTSKPTFNKTTKAGSTKSKPTTTNAITRRAKTTALSPTLTMLTSYVSTTVRCTVASTNVTLATQRNETVNTSTGLPVYVTTIPTRTPTVTVRTQKPTTIREETRTPVVMVQEGPEIDLGFTGSLYLWFIHMKENPSAYLTVFLLSAFGAILSVGAAAACVFTFKKKKHFLKLDIIHKPRRFIAAPKDAKKTNQIGHLLGKDEELLDNEELPDGMILQKGPEVIFTAHDVNNHVTKEFNIDRYSGPENGTVNKGDGGGIHVNPLFSSSNRNPVPVSTLSGNQQISSGPSTPLRNRNLTEPRTETGKRTRCNSTGNVSRSHERHAQGTSNSPGTRIKLPRHLSAGNVFSQRQAAHWEQTSQTQSPAKTLPRPSLGTSAGTDAIAQFALRNPNNWYSGGTTAPYPQSASMPPSPMKTAPGVSNQYNSQRTVPYNRQQSNGSVNLQVSLSKSTPHDPRVQPQYGPRSREVETRALSTQGSLYQHGTTNSLVNTNSVNQSPNDEVPAAQCSPHKANVGLNRKWSEEKPNNESGPNITTNPFYTSDSRDIWLKKQDPKTVERDTIASCSRPGQGHVSESLIQRGQVSNASPCDDSRPDKGTTRPASTGELLSPLDAPPEGNTVTQGLRFPDRSSYNIKPGTSSFHPLPPPPPELLTDSSDDDLYSIVAKGTYSSAAPDPNLRHSPQSGNVGSGRVGAKKNQYLSVVISSADGSTEV